MKKTLLLVLGCIIVISFSACSKSTTDSKDAAATKDVASSTGRYPEKTIELVIPAGPGGDTDTTSRGIAIPLSAILGQPVVVKNVPGGTGSIAMNEVKTATPNGYKILYYHTDFVLSKLLHRVDYNWEDAFEIAVIPGGGEATAVFVSADAPYDTFDEFIEYAKARPGEVNFAISTGGLIHMLALDIEKQAGVTFNKVDLGGSSNRIAGLLGGQVEVAMTQYGNGSEYVKNGDFKVLALLSNEKNPDLPEIPYTGQSGYDLTYYHFYLFAFPKGTPAERIDTMANAVAEATQDADYQKILGKYYYKPNVMIKDDAVEFLKDVEDKFKPLAELMIQQGKE